MYAIMQINTHKYGHGETRNKKLIKRRNDITPDDSSAGFNIALGKGREEKGKKILLLRKDDSSAGFNIALGKGREKKGKKNITTRGIRIWSPIHAVTSPSRA